MPHIISPLKRIELNHNILKSREGVEFCRLSNIDSREEIVEELRGRARDVLLTRAIAAEEQIGDARPADDLRWMEGMDEELAITLARHGITTMEDLAELSVDDLNEIAGLNDERAAKLIMTARAPWFSKNG